ncbi:MAG: ParA family protein [Chloroflexi bacterium]|nr:ParA family protein [Chloroflexota bacterium]
MPLILALANQKGGVGKTATAINLGAYLSFYGKKVLLVDIDPQANATSSLGLSANSLDYSIYDSLLDNRPLDQTISLTNRVNLDLVPSSRDLAGAEVEMVEMLQREFLLRQALAPIEGQYEFILIDSPPSLGLLTLNALCAAEGVIIPVQCEFLALEGLTHLVHTIDLVRGLNPTLHIFGLVMTMFDARTNLSSEVVSEVREHFGDRVFRTVIPRSVRLSEAPSHGEPILSYAPNSPGGLAYRNLALEVLERAQMSPAIEVSIAGQISKRKQAIEEG